jgi:hypothetical protein
MRALIVAVAAFVGATALAEPAQLPLTVGVNTGIITGAGPWRAAPAMSLNVALPLGQSPFSIVGGVGGWTFAEIGVAAARSELLTSLGIALRGGLSEHWSWTAAAAPALAIIDEAGAPMGYRPGLLLSPSLEYATRRKTLGLTIGTQAFVFGDGVRLGLTAGLAYTFH